jgi:hypothetical protein
VDGVSRRPEWIQTARYTFLQSAPWSPIQQCLNEACIAYDELLERCRKSEAALVAVGEVEWREDVDVNGEYVTNRYRDHAAIRAEIASALASAPGPPSFPDKRGDVTESVTPVRPGAES